jgi:hypothetical protein
MAASTLALMDTAPPVRETNEFYGSRKVTVEKSLSNNWTYCIQNPCSATATPDEKEKAVACDPVVKGELLWALPPSLPKPSLVRPVRHTAK